MIRSAKRRAIHMSGRRIPPGLWRFGRRRKASHPVLHWPSGRGQEIGYINGSLETVFRQVAAASSRGNPGLKVYFRNETGLRALILKGISEAPLALVEAPADLQIDERLALIADPGADLKAIHDRLVTEIGLPITFALDLG